MRYFIIALLLMALPLASAHAGVSIGISISAFPELVQVPSLPVYYDPRGSANYFFYDGAYWVYSDDSWYSSSWYDGPWDRVASEYVPLFVLRVPVQYYRRPPVFFSGWRRDAAPQWDVHWGAGWSRSHAGWNQWDRRAVPPPAPLPDYQRQYSGNRYPRAPEQQRALRPDAEHTPQRVAQPQAQAPVAPRDTRGDGQRIRQGNGQGNGQGNDHKARDDRRDEDHDKQDGVRAPGRP